MFQLLWLLPYYLITLWVEQQDNIHFAHRFVMWAGLIVGELISMPVSIISWSHLKSHSLTCLAVMPAGGGDLGWKCHLEHMVAGMASRDRESQAKAVLLLMTKPQMSYSISLAAFCSLRSQKSQPGSREGKRDPTSE